MTEKQRPNLHALPAKNGNVEDVDWEEIRALPFGERIEAIVNRSLDVFQHMGRLAAAATRAEASAASAEKSATRGEATAERMEAIALRIEKMFQRAFPTAPPPPSAGAAPSYVPPPMRAAYDSVIEPKDNDSAEMAKLRKRVAADRERADEQLALLVKERNDALVQSAGDAKRARWLLGLGKGFLVLVAVGAALWAAFTFLVNAAHR